MSGIKSQTTRSLFKIGTIAIVLLVFLGLAYKTRSQTTTNILSKPQNFLSDKIITNQWYSSAFFQKWPDTFFSFPLATKISSESVAISYPKLVPTPKTVFNQFEEDLKIIPSTPFDSQSPIATGDMHIKLELKNNNQTVIVTTAHGLPTVWVEYISGDKAVKVISPNSITEQINENTYRILTNNKSYLLTSQNASISSDLNVNYSEGGYIAITLEPDNIKLSPQDIASPLLSSGFTYKGQQIELSYIFPKNQNSVVALLPHQWEKIKNMNYIGSYHSLRGDMKSIISDKISFNYPLSQMTQIKDMINKLNSEEISELNNKISADFALMDINTMPQGVYDAGKWIFKLAQIAEMASITNHSSKQNINDRLSQGLELWLAKDSKKFELTADPHGIVATSPQYGNEDFNDHHFHYGYFLAAAAIGIELDSNLQSKIQDNIDLLIKDIANLERNTDYPYLRGFDPYEGHSWASGKAQFADGNNQESTSEAINRWYGIYRIGKVMKNTELANLGKIGLSMEQDSAVIYWLLQKPDIYFPPAGFDSEMVSILWGGKLDYATWFSAVPSHIYGIQFLPMTPAMLHIKNNFVNYTHDSANENAWNDIYNMVLALNRKQVPDTQPKYEAGNSSSFYYLWVKYWAK